MKKIISLLVAAAMVLPTGGAALAQDDAPSTATYDAAAYADAERMMDGLMGERIFGADPSAQVTRAQFVRGVTKIFGVPELGSGETVFADVAPDSEYYGAVMAAYTAGWVTAAEKFNPDDPVTLAEAVKIMLSAADYDVVARAKGGYPTGYLAAADSIDLTDSVNTAAVSGITAADADIMFYNLMLAPAFEITSYGDSLDYTKGDKTYLEKIYDVTSVRGVITATEYSSAVMDSPIIKDNGRIAIDGIEYKYAGAPGGLLGLRITAYCGNKSGSERRVFCIIPDDNKEETIIADDYDSVSGTSLSYYDGDKKRSFALNPSYKVIYNGRRVAKIEDYMVRDFGATIRLLSNDGDTKYDFVFIDGYTYGNITSIDYVDGYIGLKTPKELVDLTDDHGCVWKITSAIGEDAELFELKTGQTIALKRSADNKLFDITVLSGSASGKITAIDTADNTIYVDDTCYKMSDDFKEAYFDKDIIGVGDSITASVGMHGELVYLSSNAAELDYGYLYDVGADSSGMDRSVRAKIFTTSGKFEIYGFAEKVTIDGGASKTDREDVYTALRALLDADITAAGPNGVLSARIVRYSLNSDGEIITIDTAEERTDKFGEKLDPKDSLIKYYNKDSGALRYRSGCRGFNSKFLLGGALIMVVPKDTADRDDEEKYDICSYSSLESDTQYTVDVYDVDEYGQAAFAVIYEAADRLINTETYMIEKVTKALVDDTEGYNLHCWGNNKFSTIFMPNDVAVKKTSGKFLCSGDIVRFKMLGSKVKQVYVDYDYSSGTHVFNALGGAKDSDVTTQTEIGYVTGKVYSTNSSAITISSETDANGDTSFAFENLRPYLMGKVIALYDTQSQKIRTISAESVHTYRGFGQNADTIIMRQRYTDPRCVFVIR